MVRQHNPYRPGYNQAPLVLAGREGLLHDAEDALEVAAYDHRTPRPMILSGPRGVGKTVALGEISDLAARLLSWPTVHVEAKSRVSLLVELADRLRETTDLLEGQTAQEPRATPRGPRVAGGRIAAQAFGVGGEVQIEAAPPDNPDPGSVLRATLITAMRAATDRDAGVVVTLDELHTASAQDLGLFFAILQENVPQDWPLVVVAAALPSIRTTRGRNRLPTYLERAEWHELGPLGDHDARRALTGPAAQAGRPMSAEAADELLELAGGYPYALQVAGHFAWRTSHGATSITLAHAREARPRVRADLEQLFAGRWDDASGRERDYLTAIAHLDAAGPPRSGAVAAHLGAAASEVSYLRERLIKKGTIYPAPDGTLHFITPGMGAWIRERHA